MINEISRTQANNSFESKDLSRNEVERLLKSQCEQSAIPKGELTKEVLSVHDETQEMIKQLDQT